MAQIFTRRADTVLRLVLLALALGIAALVFADLGIARLAGWVESRVEFGHAPPQPVPFSHLHHVGEVGIDCRYCHSFVEDGPHAGYPPMHTCMGCHYPVEPRPEVNHVLRWNRVADLPDFTYFDHSIHVQKGIGCSTCHGRVDRMVRTKQAQPFTMAWCLDCHRDPVPYLRPREQVFDMAWRPRDDRAEGKRLLVAYGIEPVHLDDCHICHR
jgi:hypothetical protein